MTRHQIISSPFRIILIFIVLSIGGIGVVPLLNISLNVPPSPNTVRIQVFVNDAEPRLVEKLAIAPLENTLSTVRDIETIESISRYNSGSITIKFKKDTDLQIRRYEISSAIRSLYPDLDGRVSYPVLSEYSIDDDKELLLSYTFHGPFSSTRIEQVLKDGLIKELGKYRKLSDIQMNGTENHQIVVEYANEDLIRYGIKRTDILEALRDNLYHHSPGLVTNQDNIIPVVVSNNIVSQKDLEEVTIETDKGKLRIKDVARIYLEAEDPTGYYRINGESFITLNLYAHRGVNKINLARKIKSNVGRQSLLPPEIVSRLSYDSTEYLEKELNNLYLRAGLSALIIVLFVLVVSRDIRYLFVLFCSIVVTLLLTSLAAFLMSINIHLYSLAGIAISFGLIVDNAIVMTDHIHRNKNRKLFLALLAASSTTILALLLVLWLPEEDRLNLTDFSIIVAVSLGVSLVVALFFTPALYVLVQPKERYRRIHSKVEFIKNIYTRIIRFGARYKKVVIIFIIWAFGLPFFLLPSQWEGQEWYNSSIGSTWYQEKARPIVDKWTGGSLRLFVREVYERYSYRDKERTRLYVHAQLGLGNTIEQLNSIFIKLEEFLVSQKGIDQFKTWITDGPQGSIEITFSPEFEKSAFPYILKAQLTGQSLQWSGVNWSIYGIGQGFSTGGGSETPFFRVKMTGYNYDQVERLSEEFAKRLLVHKRIQEVNTNARVNFMDKESQELVLNLDRGKMGLKGWDLNRVVTPIKENSYKQLASMMFSTGEGHRFPVIIREKDSKKLSRFDIMQKSFNINETLVRPGSVSTMELQPTASSLYKQNRQYIRIVGFDYYGSYRFGKEYLDEVLDDFEQELPMGYNIEQSDNWWWGSQKQKKQYMLLGILIIGVFFICTLMLEHLVQPLLIIMLIPLAFMGHFLTFAWGNFYFDQGGYTAFILLGGITVNAGIYVLFDYRNRDGQNLSALIDAIFAKSNAIFLTILSTCLGMVPFLMGGEDEVFWFSLAVGTIGGLVFSVIGVFFVMPILMGRNDN